MELQFLVIVWLCGSDVAQCRYSGSGGGDLMWYWYGWCGLGYVVVIWCGGGIADGVVVVVVKVW